MKFYKSIKFKALAGALLLIIILCAAFIRIIPDFSTSRGFVIVSLPDYNKYKQGYCLKEDRILPKGELYRKAIEKYLDKKLELSKMINEYRKGHYDYYKSEYQPAYYEVENMDFGNYMKIAKQFGSQDGELLHKFYIGELGAKITDPKKYLKINLNDMSAGFEKPLIRYYGKDIFFMLNRDYILYDGYFKHNFYSDITLNEKALKSYNGQNNSGVKVYFDNCGSIKYDMKKRYLESRELNGG